jgi:hypothetical protein
MHTPVNKARNLGPVSAVELASVGIDSLEKLQYIGWEEACCRWSASFPERLNLNAFFSVIGAIEDKDWRKLDQVEKDAARALLRELRAVGR